MKFFFREALCTAVKKTLQEDALISALNHVKDKCIQKRLSILAVQMLDELDAPDPADTDATEARDAFFEHDLVGKLLKETFVSTVRFFKCLCNLLQLPTRKTLVIEDVTFFLNYRGNDTFARATKSLLSLPEPEGENFSQIKSDSRSMLQECVHDIMRTAATEGGATAQQATLLQSIQQVPKTPSPGCCDPLGEAMGKLPQLERSARKGAVNPLKQEILSTARALTEKVSQHTCSSFFLLLLLTSDIPFFCETFKFNFVKSGCNRRELTGSCCNHCAFCSPLGRTAQQHQLFTGLIF